MSSEPTAHVVFFAVEAWGHTRPLCTLALRMIQERPMNITFFTVPNFVKRIESELSRNFDPETDHLRELIRIVGLDLPEGAFLDPEQFNKYMELFAESYQRIVDGKSISCAVTGREFTSGAPPEAMIMDFFCTPAMEAARKITKRPLKVYGWMSGQATFMIYPFAPKHWGGRGDFRPMIAEEVERSGRPLAEVAHEVLDRPTGVVVRVPGMPPMYDHEFKPQAVPLEDIIGFVHLMMHSFLDQCDGVILGTAEAYEREAISHITEWYAETSREVYVIGHLLPLGENAAAGEQKQSENSTEISAFLQKTLETDGPESLIYISFGTVFWPNKPEKIWAFLDAVMEKNLPFIFSHASPFGVVPDDILAKVDTYGKGLLSKWSPQQTILSHAATGWFVTHGGQNSVMESLTLGVPMICWPYDADQPTNAARLSSVLDVAYELFEVRTEPYGLKPIHRLGRAPIGTIEAVRDEAHTVLTNAFGEDGARKRGNMKKLQEAVLSSWNEDGRARRDLRRLIATLSK